jgi:hypothetical protein
VTVEITALEKNYGCDQRPADEHDLSACLIARDRDAATAAAAEITRQRSEVAAEQARQDQEAADAARQQ